MMHSPEVSVILLQPLHLDELRSMVEIAFRQEGVDYEVLLVVWDRIEVIAPWIQTDYPQVKVILCEGNENRAAMCNMAFKVAVGDYVAFLLGGDVWVENYLVVQVKRLAEQSQALLAYCIYTDSDSQEINVEPIYLDLTAAMLLDNFIHSLSQVVL
jgi:cellulose synthase/poly-beta-1,6-N-acetylglucosamine synthase-like glycosyltransferase